jgi:hypothetical protein
MCVRVWACWCGAMELLLARLHQRHTLHAKAFFPQPPEPCHTPQHGARASCASLFKLDPAFVWEACHVAVAVRSHWPCRHSALMQLMLCKGENATQ